MYDLAHHLFHYDSDTGLLFWKNPKSRRCKPGDEAGCLRKDGYKVVYFSGKLEYVHRIIWLMVTGELPKNQIDHKDLNRSNNLFSNFREVSNQGNSFNKTCYSNSKTGHQGVYFYTRDKVFVANICVDGKTIYLGRFKNLEDAVSVREQAKVKYHKI